MSDDEQIQEHPDNLAPADTLDVSASPPPQALQSVPSVLTAAAKPRGVAPLWHTLVLVFGILAFSIWGAVRPDTGSINPLAPVSRAHATVQDGPDPVRVIRYALTGTLELVIVGWVALGLHLRKVPFRSLFGAWPNGLNNTTVEIGIAALFWICSMLVLAAFALVWVTVETQVYKSHTSHQSNTPSHSSSSPSPHSKPQAPTTPHKSESKSPEQKQVEMAKELMELAPASGFEIAAWGLLCLIVGFSEELIFRGYLQSQNIALLRNVPVSVLLTAVIFGAAHGYQGLRGIFLISIYGALFGCITLLRRNLFPGMLAHSWHDFATGMALSLIRSTHLLDHLPLPK